LFVDFISVYTFVKICVFLVSLFVIFLYGKSQVSYAYKLEILRSKQIRLPTKKRLLKTLIYILSYRTCGQESWTKKEKKVQAFEMMTLHKLAV